MASRDVAEQNTPGPAPEARARASELEAHVTRANRCAAAHAKHSAEESKAIAARLAEVEELSHRLDSNLKSTKLVLRLREDALVKLKKGEDADEAGPGRCRE